MLNHVKRHAIAYLALLLALTTSAYAAGNIPKDSITGREVKESSLATVPSAKSAAKLKSQVNKTLKLNAVANPTTNVTKVGAFSFGTKCLDDGGNPHLSITLTAANQFAFEDTGVATLADANANPQVLDLFSPDPNSLVFSIMATTRAGNKVSAISGFIQGTVNLHNKDCIAIFHMTKTQA
jgi:hypothetical protein